jgi:hypothetical protein
MRKKFIININFLVDIAQINTLDYRQSYTSIIVKIPHKSK